MVHRNLLRTMASMPSQASKNRLPQSLIARLLLIAAVPHSIGQCGMILRMSHEAANSINDP